MSNYKLRSNLRSDRLSMENDSENYDLPLTIEDHLENINDNIPINTNQLDELVYKIKANTGLEIDIVRIIVQNYFQEIRNQCLRGKSIMIDSFGKFYISSFKTTKAKKNVKIIFKPSRILKERVK